MNGYVAILADILLRVWWQLTRPTATEQSECRLFAHSQRVAGNI